MKIFDHDSQKISWVSQELPSGLKPGFIYIGNAADGNPGIQIAVIQAETRPSRTKLRQVHDLRVGKTNISFVVAVELSETVLLFGPNRDSEEIELKKSVAHRVMAAVLSEPTELAAYARLVGYLRGVKSTDMPGFINNGLFASYHLKHNVISRDDWQDHQDQSTKWVKLRNRELITAMGFEISSTDSSTLMLKTKDNQDRVVAVLLDQSENFESKSARFSASPVEWALSVASKHKVPWVVALRDSQVRLYPAKDGVGVGQKSQIETYFEVDLVALDEDLLGLMDLVFSARALADGGTSEELLLESQKYAVALGARLRERIYESVIPALSMEVASRLRAKGLVLDEEGLSVSYRLTLRILFRLLFQAYAEDRGLLPEGRNELYDKNSLKGWSKTLLNRSMDREWSASATIWFDLLQVWNAIDEGNSDMAVPAYNGGLFGADSNLHPEGALIASIQISDSTLGPVLVALLLDATEDGVIGPVDFRSLSVREFGTIYEGLLESSLSVASQNLTIDQKNAWVPAVGDDTVLVEAGEVYFHSSSGDREATGSYYTPAFVVDHLVEQAIVPSLENHLAEVRKLIEKGDDASAHKKFFDFKVADLAMGSGHFLVSAIDKIEGMMRDFLTSDATNIPGVMEELDRLESAAKNALGKNETSYAKIERASLLRRQIARRCIYGLDINPLAVELSRLAIWIHTFVPGLPMSSLDHGLVCGNSLTGFASIDEVMTVLLGKREIGQRSYFDKEIEDQLEASKKLLAEAADISEATKGEAKVAQQLAIKARLGAQSVKDLFDVATAIQMREISSGTVFTAEDVTREVNVVQVQKLVSLLNPAHFPFLFPEVFEREEPGFDVLLGNPPFKEATVEELSFWNRNFPGLKSLSSTDSMKQLVNYRSEYPELLALFRREQQEFEVLRKSLGRGCFPGMSVGDADLYKAFAWRFHVLLRRGGRAGLVLPNSIWNTKGNAEWRKAVFATSNVQANLVKNTGEWVFQNVNAGYRFTFVTIKKDSQAPSVRLNGTFETRESFDSGKDNYESLSAQEIVDSEPEATLPTLDGNVELQLWRKLLSVPKLGDGRLTPYRSDFRCAPMTEIHVSNDGRLRGVFTNNSADWPVYNHKNVGNLKWDVSVGSFNYADFQKYVAEESSAVPKLQNRDSSALSLFTTFSSSQPNHPILFPRIVFRDVVHASNQRKVWFSLAPRNVLLTNKAPYLIFDARSSDVLTQAYVLGILSSGIVDWMGSLKIGLTLNFFILYNLPVPIFVRSEIQIRIAELAARLSIGVDGDFGEWSQLGAPLVDEDERNEAIAEIDGLATMLFGLSEPEMKVIYGAGNPLRSSYEDILRKREEWLEK